MSMCWELKGRGLKSKTAVHLPLRFHNASISRQTGSAWSKPSHLKVSLVSLTPSPMEKVLSVIGLFPLTSRPAGLEPICQLRLWLAGREGEQGRLQGERARDTSWLRHPSVPPVCVLDRRSYAPLCCTTCYTTRRHHSPTPSNNLSDPQSEW